jgi:membrane-associated phospholipid phosphatase
MIAPIRTGIKKFFAALALLSIEILIAIAIFLLALIAFIQVARMVFLQNKEAIDLRAFDFLSGYVTDFNSDVMQFFTFLGTHHFLIPANFVLIFYFLFIRRHRWYSIKIPVVSLSSLLLMYVLKFLFNRPRPLIPLLKEAQGLSFPSGHALNSMAFYGLIIYLVWRNVKHVAWKWTLIIALSLLILTIGLSRVYLRVHYASDVVAGFCVGLMWLILSISLLKQLENFSRKKVTPVLEETKTENEV